MPSPTELWNNEDTLKPLFAGSNDSKLIFPSPPPSTRLSKTDASLKVLFVDFAASSSPSGIRCVWLKGTDLVLVQVAETTEKKIQQLKLADTTPKPQEIFLYSLSRGVRVPFHPETAALEEPLDAYNVNVSSSTAPFPFVISVDHMQEDPYRLFRVDPVLGPIPVVAVSKEAGVFPGLAEFVGDHSPQSTSLGVLTFGSKVLFADRLSANEVKFALYNILIVDNSLSPKLLWKKTWEAPVYSNDRLWPSVMANDDVIVLSRYNRSTDEDEESEQVKQPAMTLFFLNTSDGESFTTLNFDSEESLFLTPYHQLMVLGSSPSAPTPTHLLTSHLVNSPSLPIGFRDLPIAAATVVPTVSVGSNLINGVAYSKRFWETGSGAFEILGDRVALRTRELGIEIVDLVDGKRVGTSLDVGPTVFRQMECLVTYVGEGRDVKFDQVKVAF